MVKTYAFTITVVGSGENEQIAWEDAREAAEEKVYHGQYEAKLIPVATPPDDVWGSDSDYPREDWQMEVANGDTNLGYWEWVEHERQVAADNPDTDGGSYSSDAIDGRFE